MHWGPKTVFEAFDSRAKRRLLHQRHYHRFGDERQEPTMRLFHQSRCFEFVRVGLMILMVLGPISDYNLA